MSDPVFYFVSIVQVPVATPGEKNCLGPLFHREPDINNGNHSGQSPLALRNAWVFQSNPVLYDLRGALRELKEQVWSVSRYAQEIRAGDRVYLWEAGRHGGIVGVAEISEPARLQPEPPEQLPFARVAEAFAGERLRARLKVLRIIDPVIPRQSVASSPDLGGLGVLRCSRGTNFRLNPDQWHALNGLIVGGAA
jgi:hypothetical protein